MRPNRSSSYTPGHPATDWVVGHPRAAIGIFVLLVVVQAVTGIFNPA